MSECSCIYVETVDGPSCSKEETRKARKIHKCCECHKEIKKGQKYQYESGIWDGKPESYKICLDCLSMRDTFFCGGWVYGEIWSDLWNHLSENDGEISSDCLENLTPIAKDKVFKMIEEIWEELDEE